MFSTSSYDGESSYADENISAPDKAITTQAEIEIILLVKVIFATVAEPHSTLFSAITNCRNCKPRIARFAVLAAKKIRRHCSDSQ